MPRMLELAIRTWRQPGMDEACERFFTDTPVPDDILSHPDHESLFLTWLALRFAPEVPVKRRSAGAARVAERTAARMLLDDATDVSEFERRWLTAAAARPVSFYAVADVVPGVSVQLEDLFTGATYRVWERTASQALRRGGVVYARVVTLDGVSIMIGMSSVELPPIRRPDVGDLRRALTGSDRLMTDEEVLFLEDPVRRWYLLAADAVLHPPPPKFTNTDGDPLAPTTLHFRAAVHACRRVRSAQVPQRVREGRGDVIGRRGARRGRRLARLPSGVAQGRQPRAPVVGQHAARPDGGPRF
jgi:hypothetical protein